MIRLILARLPQMFLVVIGCTLVTFILVNVLPGNIIFVILGNNYTKHAAEVLTQELGLNKPLLVRYFDWLGGALHGDFGRSLTTHVSVTHTIFADLPPTIELVIGGQLVATGLGIALAIASVASGKRWLDRTNTGFALFCTSMPSFVLALLLLALLAARWHLVSPVGWVSPSQGGWGANLSAIALPCILLGLGFFPGHMRIFRTELLDQMEGEEYVTLARMKGISTFRLMSRHVARNSSFGLVTVLAVSTAGLVGGAVILEQIFAIPGIGQLIITSLQTRDSPTVEACVTLVAVLIVIMNLVADITYAVLDPRVRDSTS